MGSLYRGIAAVLLGVVVGSIVNMGLVQLGMALFPLPGDFDPNDFDQLAAALKQAEPVHFLFPFLAHALGTLVGAFTAAKIAEKSKFKFALGIGVWFLLGGVAMVVLVGGPIWFILADLLLAYIPMGYLGGMFAGEDNAPAAALATA